MFVIEASDLLDLPATGLFRGVLIYGAGTLRQLGDIIVDDDTNMDVAIFDWGNSTPGDVHQTTVKPDANFQINSGATGTANNEHRGTMILENGVLTVETDVG